MDSIFWGIVGSIFGAVVVLLVKEPLSYLKSRKGILSGEWYQIIYNEKGKMIKKDKVVCQHIGDKVKGFIQRLEPPGQNFKRWQFEGQIRDDLLFGIFWTSDPIKNPNSYGTLQLTKVDSNLLKGFYGRLQPQTSPKGLSFLKKLTPITFEWKRIQRGES